MTDAATGAQPEQKAHIEAEVSDWRTLRGEIFIWIGIVGGALTLVNHWSNFITLADWTHWLVGHFSALMHSFWNVIASLAGIKITVDVSKVLTFFLSYLSLTFGTVIMAGYRLNTFHIHIIRPTRSDFMCQITPNSAYAVRRPQIA
jgi:hypothetical protein